MAKVEDGSVPMMQAPRTMVLAEQVARILADAKIMSAAKFVDGAYATDRRVPPEKLREGMLRDLAFDLARALVEQVPLRSVLMRDEVPSRGPGYEYRIDLVLLTRGQLEDLSRLNRDIRRAADDRPSAAEAVAAMERGAATEEPKEAPPDEFWRWRFPRAGRYYAQGRYVDVAEDGAERDLPPGYPLWITAEGVHAERIPPSET